VFVYFVNITVMLIRFTFLIC